MEADHLQLNDDLEQEEQEEQTYVGLYEDVVSMLSDPSQLLYKAVDSTEDEYLVKLKYFFNCFQKMDGTCMPYIKDT